MQALTSHLAVLCLFCHLLVGCLNFAASVMQCAGLLVACSTKTCLAASLPSQGRCFSGKQALQNQDCSPALLQQLCCRSCLQSQHS